MPEPRPPAATARTFRTNLARLVRGRRAPFVLCYHGLGAPPPEGDPHGLLLAPETFADQLDALMEAGYRLVTAHELWRRVEDAGLPAAAGLGAITFDDGLEETLRLAAPIAARRGAALTAYVPSALLGGEHPDLPGRSIVDAAQLRALADDGLEVGGHGAAHGDLASLGPQEVRAELRDSRARLVEVLDREITGMAYPFGRYTADTVAAAHEAGFGYACACAGAGPWRPYEIPREPVFPSTSTLRLRVKAAGMYGPVHAVRRRP